MRKKAGDEMGKYVLLNYLRQHTPLELINYCYHVIEHKAEIETDMATNAAMLAEEIIDSHKGKFHFDKFTGNILEIAQHYGLSLHGTKTLCPFHADTKPSLVFYPKENKFVCYGCNEKGDVIKFIGLMEGVYGKKGSRKNSKRKI